MGTVNLLMLNISNFKYRDEIGSINYNHLKLSGKIFISLKGVTITILVFFGTISVLKFKSCIFKRQFLLKNKNIIINILP